MLSQPEGVPTIKYILKYMRRMRHFLCSPVGNRKKDYIYSRPASFILN